MDQKYGQAHSKKMKEKLQAIGCCKATILEEKWIKNEEIKQKIHIKPSLTVERSKMLWYEHMRQMERSL